jgi:putative peptidoglycan lipid II flippase
MNYRNIFKIAGLMGLITVLSKVLGFARDMVIAQAYGASLTSDAYFYAYQIPAITFIILGGLGGPFHTVTVSIFSKANTQAGRAPDEFERALNSFMNITGLGFLAVTVMVFFNADLLAKLIAMGGSPELHSQIADQLKIMSPIILIGGIVGILFGISNVYDKFLITAVSPTISSIVTIVAVLFAGGHYGGLVLAWSTLIGSALQLVAQIPAYFDTGYKYRFDLDWNNPSVKKIGEILFPAILSCSIGQVNVYVDMFFASQLPEGSWSAIGYANRIFQFPAGTLITAMMISIFPAFSRLVGQQDWQTFRTLFHRGISILLLASFPVLVLLTVFPHEIIKVLFERGVFDANDTLMVANALFYLSFALIFYVGRDTLTRVFYAFDDTKTPFIIAIVSIIAKGLLNLVLVKPFGIAGICISTALVSGLNGLLLAFLVRKNISLGYRQMLPNFCKILVATAAMTGFVLASKLLLGHALGVDKLHLMINVAVSCTLGGILYFAMAVWLKVETAKEIADSMKAKVLSFVKH